MNEEMYKQALKRIEELTLEEIFQMLQECGIDATVRQYPEPEMKEEDGQATH